MGGGVGISVHGSHRVVGDRTLFAMPETGIGLFPDVGGSYFLPRLPGRLGHVPGPDRRAPQGGRLLYAGVGTDYVPEERATATWSPPGARRTGAPKPRRRSTTSSRLCIGRSIRRRSPSSGRRSTAVSPATRCRGILAALTADGGDWEETARKLPPCRRPPAGDSRAAAARRGAGFALHDHGVPPEPSLHGRPRLLRGHPRRADRQGQGPASGSTASPRRGQAEVDAYFAPATGDLTFG